MRLRGWGLVMLLLAACSDSSAPPAATPSPSPTPALRADLPLPSLVARRDYQQALYAFLGERRYRSLGWRRDKEIRDTGPYRDGTYYGTHPAVRVYYSPEVLEWLTDGRRGDLPDGAMIIKEMYPPPALRYEGVPESALPIPTWTVMTRDRAGAVDGWFWTYFDSNPRNLDPPVAQAPDETGFPFPYPDSDFGSYCVRCHASADSLMTFVTTENIEGFPGEPLRYDVDDSWRDDPNGPGEDPHPHGDPETPTPSPHDFVNADWQAFYDQLPPLDRAAVTPIPGISHDRVVADGHNQFVTSDQCEPCHSGDTSPFGPNLMVEKTDLSPYGEWRWSMMGLAGRDPIFYAQLESELARHGASSQLGAEQIENFCLHCHGVMGQRQFTADRPTERFRVDLAMAHGEGDPAADYGGLARDGISCAVCHRIRDDADLPLAEVQNGNFLVDPPDAEGVLPMYGPFDDPVDYSMLGTLAVRPVRSAHIESSRVCASCHTVFLPVLDADGHVVGEDFEQATYLEWVNSAYAAGDTARSCQDCHMPGTFGGQLLSFEIANIQDDDFPPTSFLAPLDRITVDKRDGYRRHLLQGANVFALELFRNFPDVLGVRLRSFMTGLSSGLGQAIENAVVQAGTQTARVEILDVTRQGAAVDATVRVTNLTGHRLPSGVGFRRLILEVVVLDGAGQVLWGSGRTNDLGVVVDAAGAPLPSELHEIDPISGEQAYQPHYQTIDSQDRAQLYEELSKDPQGVFTTSFLARAETVKDNRLLPTGWSETGPPGFPAEHAHATSAHGGAAHDVDFTDGTGSDTVTYTADIGADAPGPIEVRATLYYQAIPPRYLRDRFAAGGGPAARRLHYLTSHLDDSATAFAGWKLPLAAARRSP